MLEKLKKFGWGYLLIATLLIAIGVLFISAQNAYEVLAIIMGCILAAVGIGFSIYALIDKERGLKFGIRLSIGIIAIVCGVVTLIARSSAIATIANVFFLLLIIDGAFKLQLSILSRRLSYYGWWIVTGLSVAIIICTFLLCKLTPSDPARLATLSGVVIIADGILNLLSAFFSSALGTRGKGGDKKDERTKDTDTPDKSADLAEEAAE